MKIVYFLIGILISFACRNEDLKTESIDVIQNHKEISNENVFGGTWINSKFFELIRKKKSILESMDSLKYYPLVAFQLNSDTLNYFCGSLTEGAESILSIDSLFINNNLECIGLNNVNLSEICYKNNQLLLKGSSIPNETEYIKISNIYHDYDSSFQFFLCMELFEGNYINLEENDTIMISKNKIYFSNNLKQTFKIGLEFLSIPFDYIEISEIGKENSEFYHYKFKDNVLNLKLLEYVKDGDIYKISNQKSFKLLKIK